MLLECLPSSQNPPARQLSQRQHKTSFHIEKFSAMSPPRRRRPPASEAVSQAKNYFFGGCAVGGKIPFSRK
jgi:hypothetical protein